MRGRFALLALAAGLGLGAVSCGGGEGTDVAAGADVVPVSADVFVAVNTEFEGDQWQTAEQLVDKFPGGDTAVRELLGELEEEGVDFERDVKPAVGPEVDIVVLDVRTGEDEPEVVGLTQPRDREKFEALMEKGDEPTVYEFVDDWAVFADDQAALDRFKEARGEDSLADADAFKNAMDDLPEDALAKAYVNGEVFTRALRQSDDAASEYVECLPGGRAPSYGAAIRAEQEGVRFDAAARTEGGPEPETYEAELDSELPAGALAYVSFNNLAEGIRTFLRCAGDADPEFDRGIAQVELGLGVSLEEDLLPLFENEGAVAVYRSEAALAQAGRDEVPTVSLVLQVEDERKAVRTLDRIAERATAFMEDLEVSEVDIDGVAAKQVTGADGELGVYYAALDGMVVVTSAEQGIAGLNAEGDKLADDAAYTDAVDAADAPDETTGFFYANLEDGLDYVLGLAEQSEGERPPADVRENVEPLRSLFLHGSFEDDTSKAQGFLSID